MMNPGELEAIEMVDEYGAELGDPRHCPCHPHVIVSSPDGMFDTVCHECEAYMDNWDESDLTVVDFSGTSTIIIPDSDLPF